MVFKLRRTWFSLSVHHKRKKEKKKESFSREKVVSLQKAIGKNTFNEPLSLHSGYRPSVLKKLEVPYDTGLDASFSSSGGGGLCGDEGVTGTALKGGDAS